MKTLNGYLILLALMFNISNLYPMQHLRKALATVALRRHFSTTPMNAKKAYAMFKLNEHYKYSESDLKKIKLHLSKLYHPDLNRQPLFENNANDQFHNIEQALFHIKKIQELTDSIDKNLTQEELNIILRNIETDYKQWKLDIEYEECLRTQKEENDKKEQENQNQEAKTRRIKFLTGSTLAGSTMYLLYQYKKSLEEKSQEFIDAVKSNDIEKVKSLLADRHFEYLNTKDSSNNTALHLAVRNNNIDIVLLLIGEPRIDLHTLDDYDNNALFYVDLQHEDIITDALYSRVSKLISKASKKEGPITSKTDTSTDLWKSHQCELSVKSQMTEFLRNYNVYRNEILRLCLSNINLLHNFISIIQKKALTNNDFEMTLILSMINPYQEIKNMFLIKNVYMGRLIKKYADSNSLASFNSRELILEIIIEPKYPIELIEEYSSFYGPAGKPRCIGVPYYDFGSKAALNPWCLLFMHNSRLSEERIFRTIQLLEKFALKDLVFLPIFFSYDNGCYCNDYSTIKSQTLKDLLLKIYQKSTRAKRLGV